LGKAFRQPFGQKAATGGTDSIVANFRNLIPPEETMNRFAKILAAGCLSWLPLASAAEAVPFQQYKNGACTSSLTCTVEFNLVPGGRRLDVTNVSCYLRAGGTVELLAMQLLVTEGGATRSAVTLVPAFVDTTGTQDEWVYSANATIFAFAKAGQRFLAYAELKKGTFSQFACHISGQFQNTV
jgi:hypothetical protein